MPSRFRFRGSAIGAAGQITRPFHEVIEIQAATALPHIGGHGTARSVDFRHRDILRFDLARTEVTGSEYGGDGDDSRTTRSTRVVSVVEGLNIHDVITADRVMAVLVSAYGPEADGEPSVRLTGTHFDNLKVAGVPLELDLAVEEFDKHHTRSLLASAYRKDKKIRGLVDQLTLSDRANEAPPHILRWITHTTRGAELPDARGFTALSLVRGIKPDPCGLVCFGHIIHIEGFGTIRLAEVEISRTTRNVNMIQVNFGSPTGGHVAVGAVTDGGDGY